MNRLLGVVLGCLWALPALAGDRLIARVHPAWSPYARGPAVGAEALVEEARGLLAEDPARVAAVLGGAPVPAGPAARVVQGLRADALYRVGGDQLRQAQRGYRDLAAARPGPEEAAWLAFMEGTIHQGLGFVAEAETAYQAAAAGPPGPWSAALTFNRGVLALESGRHAEAQGRFAGWLAAYPAEPGRALVLALLGECEAGLGNRPAALQRFTESRALQPAAVLVRPAAAHALAGAWRQEGRVAEAAELLEALADARPGTPEGAQARLEVGVAWEAAREPGRTARAYARLLDEGAPSAEADEARLRLALLGVTHGATLQLTEPFPAYRVLYRPKPTLEEFAGGRDPLAAQRALRGLSGLARAEGDAPGALALLTRAFRTFPESPESGRAYEEFMGLLEGYLAERLGAGAPGDVIAVYETFRGSIGWAATRDTGAAALRAAEAYEALGAPRLARRVYEDLAARGTRQVTPEELDARTIRARAGEGDPGALRRWASRPEADWKARRSLARSLARGGAGTEARAQYQEAVRAAPGAAEALTVLTEAGALGAGQATEGDLLGGLEARRQLWSELPAGAERDAWGAHGRVVEGRLRIASGDWAGAARAYGSAAGLEAADAYLLALAEARGGRPAVARELLAAVAAAGDATFSPLAALHLEVAALRVQAGRP